MVANSTHLCNVGSVLRCNQVVQSDGRKMVSVSLTPIVRMAVPGEMDAREWLLWLLKFPDFQREWVSQRSTPFKVFLEKGHRVVH